MLPGLRECADKDSSQETHGEAPLFFQKFSEKEAKPYQRVSWPGTVTRVLPTSQSLAFALLCLGCRTLGTAESQSTRLLRWCEGSIRNQLEPESLPTSCDHSSQKRTEVTYPTMTFT